MLFPKSRMRFTTTYQGKSSPEGWIVLELTGVDLEGANKIYLPMEEIEKLKQRGDTAADKLKQARALLGGDMDAE
ncbi:MAG TPA: hypothetical protein VFB38_01315 [Chthonomonadaceae bacterium]|nr:hypothetical protein [Chthonomonadaceae bacterium]